jgi:peptidoglycan/LPS O-acetylase OafA/YrhL
VEEQFYLVWPLVVRHLDERRLRLACIALIGGAPIWRLLLTDTGISSIGIYVLPLSHMDALATGALIALLARRPAELEILARRVRRYFGLLLVYGGAVIFLNGGFGWYRPLMQVIGYTVAEVIFGSLLVLVLVARPGSPLRTVFETRVLCTFGCYSYGLYLLHRPVLNLLIGVGLTPASMPRLFGSIAPAQLAFYVVGFSLSLAAAWISWQCLEQPFLRLKRFFPYSTGGAAMSAVAPAGHLAAPAAAIT